MLRKILYGCWICCAFIKGDGNAKEKEKIIIPQFQPFIISSLNFSLDAISRDLHHYILQYNTSSSDQTLNILFLKNVNQAFPNNTYLRSYIFLQIMQRELLQNNLGNALKYYYYAIELANDDCRKANILGISYEIFKNLNLIDSAKQQLYIALKHFKRGKHLANELISYSNLAIMQEEFDSSIYYFNQVIKKCDSLELLKQKDYSFIYYGVIYNISKQYFFKNYVDSALSIIKKIPLSFLVSNPKLAISAFNLYGAIFQKSKKPYEAIKYYKLSLTHYKLSPFNDKYLSSLQAIHAIYQELKQYDSALHYALLYQELYEKEVANSKSKAIEQLRHQNELETHNKELAEQNLHNTQKLLENEKKQKWYSTIGLITLIFIIGILISIRQLLNRQKLLSLKLKAAEKDKKIIEYDAILKGKDKERQRIAQEIHDHVVSEFTILKLNLKTFESRFPGLHQDSLFRSIFNQSINLGQKLRAATHEMMPTKYKSYNIAIAVQDYIEQLFFSEIKFDFQCFGDITSFEYKKENIILAIIKELIQNTIKHAKATEVLIQINFLNDSLSITVEDNGIGCDKEVLLTSGLGWINIRKNVNLLNGEIDIETSLNKGTTVLLEFSIHDLIRSNQTAHHINKPNNESNHYRRP